MSTRMNRQDRERKRKSFIKYSILFLITVMAIGLTYRLGQNVSTWHSRYQLETIVAKYGCLEDKLQGEGLVLRSETTILAPSNGYFENVVTEKEKVARNVIVGYYISSGNKITMRAPTAGIFTQQVDGLETVLKGIKLENVGPEVFNYKEIRADSAKEIKADQGIYKIVNNLVPSRLLVHFPLEGLNLKISEQQMVELLINEKSLGYYKVLTYKKDFNELIMIIESNEFKEDLLNRRLVNVKLRFNSSNGYLVPEKSLTKRGNEKGIYCTRGEDILFKTVKVLDKKNDTAVVEGLEDTDLIVINPEKLKHKL